MSNESGSAKLPESDEITQQILISISTIDDDPVMQLWSTERLYNPKLLSLVGKNKTDFSLTYEYGIYDKRKRKTITITPKGCFVSK